MRRDGLGLGLRTAHHAALAERAEAGVDFFEVVAENFLGPSAVAAHHLARARSLAPVVVHGVSLDLLGPTPLDRDHLRMLKALADRLDAPYVTEHLCWSAIRDRRLHDLLPAPMTPRLARYAAERARVVQDVLERPFGLENLSPMLALAGSTLDEWAFYAEVVEGAGCGYLLDVNNVIVSAANTGVDPDAFLGAIDPARVLQVHVAGHRRPPRGPIHDTHDAPVGDDVWALYVEAWRRLGPFPTLLEWDADLPPYDACLGELAKAAERRAGVAPAPVPTARVPTGRSPRGRAPAPAPEDVVVWQHQLAELVAEPLVFAPPRASVDVDAYPPATVAAVRPTPRIGAVDGLRAYHEQSWFRLLSALQGAWPTVCARLGAWRFNELATAFLREHPPRARDLAEVGAGLDAFLARSAWDAEDLREAAAVDRAWSELMALPPLPAWVPEGADLAARRLRPSPALRRLTLRWPMPLLREAALARDDEAPLALPEPDPGTWLLFRTPDLALVRLRAEPALGALLEALERWPLAEAVGQLRAVDRPGEPPLVVRIERWFAAGVRWGWWLGAEGG